MKPFLSLMLLIAGIAIALGGLGHSLEGSVPVRLALEKHGIPIPLERLVVAVWHFCGAAMVVLGVLVLGTWREFQSGRRPKGVAHYLTGAFYLAYGPAAVAYTGMAFFWVFFGLGLTVLVSSLCLSRAMPGYYSSPPTSR